MKTIQKLFLLFIILTFFISQAFAIEDGFTVKKIRVTGLHRISEGTVLNYLPVQIGRTIEPEDTTDIIKALYKTGFFNDIALKRQGSTLIVSVTERPVIASIKISGNAAIPTKDLMQSLKSYGFSEGLAYDPSLLDNIRDSLQREYINRGNYNAKVTTTVTEEVRNRVAININVYEGPSAKIKNITIIGNKTFSDKKLIRQFKLEKSHFYSFVTGSDKYSDEKMKGDLATLGAYYMDRGFVKFKIDSYEIKLTPDKKYVNIIIHITEGDRYTLKGYKLAGSFTEPKEKLAEFVDLQPGEVFSRKKVTAISQKIGNYLGNYGYEFARVQPIPEIDDSKKQVFITFLVTPGNRFYVRKISFSGNTKTQDDVLRRNLTQQEGALYNLAHVKGSETNLRLLPYFKDVSVDAQRVPGSDDMVDLNYKVAEAPSATLTAGVGWNNVYHLMLNASYNQPNFLGTGKTIGVSASTSSGSDSFGINYYDPFYTKSGIGRGFSLYAHTLDTSEVDWDSANYTMDTYGGNVLYNIPLAQHDQLSLSFGYGYTYVKTGACTSKELYRFMQNPQDPNSVTTVPPLLGYIDANNPGCPGTQDVDGLGSDPAIGTLDDHRRGSTRNFHNINLALSESHLGYDRAIFPTRGYAQTTGLTVALPAGGSDDISYYTASHVSHFYQPLGRGFILSLRGEVAYGGGLFNTDYLPFYSNYGAGGVSVMGQVRGYETYSIGPKDSLDNTFGGNFLGDGSIGLILPLPITPDQFRVTTFVDFGNVYNTTDLNVTRDGGPMRFSAGIQAEWRTPMGPMVFSLATPLNKQHGDREEGLQFSVGAAI